MARSIRTASLGVGICEVRPVDAFRLQPGRKMGLCHFAGLSEPFVEFGRAALARHQQHAPCGRRGVHGFENTGDARRVAGLTPRRFTLSGPEKGLGGAPVFPVDHGKKESGEIAELLVDDGAADAAGFGHPVERDSVEAFAVRQIAGDVHDLPAALLDASCAPGRCLFCCGLAIHACCHPAPTVTYKL